VAWRRDPGGMAPPSAVVNGLSSGTRWILIGAATVALVAVVAAALAVRPDEDIEVTAPRASPAALVVRLLPDGVEVSGRVRDDASARSLAAGLTAAFGTDVEPTRLELDDGAPDADVLVPRAVMSALARLQTGTFVRAGNLVMVDGVVGAVADEQVVERVMRDTFRAGSVVELDLTVGAPGQPSLRLRSEGELVEVSGIMANTADRDAVIDAAAEIFGAGAIVGTLEVGRTVVRPPWVDGLSEAVRAMGVFLPGWTLEVAPRLGSVLVGGVTAEASAYADAIARISGATGLTVRAWIPTGDRE
jgi:hypothetical protein